MCDLTEAIRNLQEQWQFLRDIDRATMLFEIHSCGCSIQSLATAMNCSASLLRHLLRTLGASSEDLELARSGQISTRALALHSNSTGIRPTSRGGFPMGLPSSLYIDKFASFAGGER